MIDRQDLIIWLLYVIILLFLLEKFGFFKFKIFQRAVSVFHPSEYAAFFDLIRTMYEESPLAWVAVDSKGKVILWSPVASEKFGYTAVEAMGVRLEDLVVPPELKAGYKKHLEKFLNTGVSEFVGNKFGFETEGMTKKGERIPVRIVAIDMSKNGLRKVGAYIYNRTHEIEKERVYKDKIKLLECGEEVAGLGSWWWMIGDKDDTVIVSKHFRKIFGLSENEKVTSAMLTARVFEEDRDDVVKTMDNGFLDQKDYKISYRIDRTKQWVHCIAIVVPGEKHPETIHGTIQEIDYDG